MYFNSSSLVPTKLQQQHMKHVDCKDKLITFFKHKCNEMKHSQTDLMSVTKHGNGNMCEASYKVSYHAAHCGEVHETAENLIISCAESGWGMKITTHLQLVPRSRIHGSIHRLHSPIHLHGIVLNQLCTWTNLPNLLQKTVLCLLGDDRLSKKFHFQILQLQRTDDMRCDTEHNNVSKVVLLN
jgi:hypothetical protein